MPTHSVLGQAPACARRVGGYSPYADCSVDKVVHCTRHMEMGTIVLVQAKGQDNAQPPLRTRTAQLLVAA